MAEGQCERNREAAGGLGKMVGVRFHRQGLIGLNLILNILEKAFHKLISAFKFC